MTLSGQALARQYQVNQINNGAMASVLVMEICNQYRAGRVSEADFVGALVAQSKLSHDKATAIATDFLTAYRLVEAPDEDHADPLLSAWDGGAAFGRAYGVSQDLAAIDVEPLYYESEFQKIAQNFAVRSHRYALNAGRETIEFSAAANGKRWRRITDGNPCAFCAMLSTRSDYRTKESALTVVGRQTGYGTAVYRSTGQVRSTGRTRGTQALGDRYHNFCGCTVVEVLSEWVSTPAEQAQHDLYQLAAKQCDADGVPRTAKNVLQRMRQSGEGIIHDATPPATQTSSGDSGGEEPPRRLLASFWEDRPRSYIPPEPGFTMPFDRETRPRTSWERAGHILARHAHDAIITRDAQTFFPADFSEIDTIKELTDLVTYLADPKLRGQSLQFEAEIDGVVCLASVRSNRGEWEVRSMWPVAGRDVMVSRDNKKYPVGEGLRITNYSQMTNTDKLRAAGEMYGTNSPEYQQAKKRFR